MVPSSADEDSSDEGLLIVGLLFLFFLFLVAALELTAFGGVDLETSDVIDLGPLDLLDEDLVTVTGFAPDPELQGTTLATSTLGILYSDGGLSLAISSLLGVSTSFTLLGGVI